MATAPRIPGPEVAISRPDGIVIPVWYEKLKFLFDAFATVNVAAQFDKAGAAAGQTGLLLWDADNGTLERVTVGAADSGGAGFKLLRIPN